MTKPLRRLNSIVGYVALFVALGGTSYASIRSPQHVTIQQAPKAAKAGVTCGGNCPAHTVMWAYFGNGPSFVALGQPNGTFGVLQTAVGGYRATLQHVGVGSWIVRFPGQDDLSNCGRFANLTEIRGSATVLGYGSQDFSAPRTFGYNPVMSDPKAIPVLTTDTQGNPIDAAFDVLVLCGGGQALLGTPAAPSAAYKPGATNPTTPAANPITK